MVPLNDNEPAPNRAARAIINRQRRRIASAKLVLVLLLAGAWWFLVPLNLYGDLVLIAFLGFVIVCVSLDRYDVCPRCKGRISALPSEGHLRLPELSRAVRLCPYCGMDFSFDRPE